MLLLTGATGEIGSALLPRLLAHGTSVRCLVRDPRRLGTQRVRVQIALGDLADPPSFRNAMRGVDTVVHLAAAIRDQPQGSIEELNGIATWRMVQAAREAGVQRFVFFSAIGASTHHRSRFFRAKALAEQAVREAGIACTIFSPSIVYAPRDRWLTLLERMSLAGLTPMSGSGKALYQPIWAEDVADCVAAVLQGQPGRDGDHNRNGVASTDDDGESSDRSGRGGTGQDEMFGHYELAGPETLSENDIVRLVLRSLGRPERLLHVPTPVVSRFLGLVERIAGPSAFATWDEAELMEVPMVSVRGAADAEALGVKPQRMETVLGVG